MFIFYISAWKCHDRNAESCCKPYPLLLIQRNINYKVLLVKIAAEKSLITAGSSVEEGIERLFKLFWCFNLKYTEECATFFKFLQFTTLEKNSHFQHQFISFKQC